MKIKAILLFTILTCGVSLVNAEPIKIAVIDTGFDMKHKDKVKLCDSSLHRDFTNTGLHDNHGHGTNIAGLIAKHIKVDYCLVIIKYWTKESSSMNTLHRTILAIDWAVLKGVDMINYSGGGIAPNEHERMSVIGALNEGIVFVSAAGNESTNLNKGTYYPAMYDHRIVVVGNVNSEGERAPSSNYGRPLDLSVVGINKSALGVTLTGTSQSTAIVTGRLANQVYIRKLLGQYDTDKYSFSLDRYMAQ
jgi:subtilisin family serine protease